MSQIDLQCIHDFAVEIAMKASAMILEASKARLANFGSVTSEKTNSADLVTDTDKEVEKMVSAAIRQTFPHHRFIGEESAGEESVHEEHIDDSFTWVVDPIDGTTNFVHGIPDVSISIGFMIVARPVVGVVLNPFTAHLYTAIRGAGSYETILSPDLTKVIERHKLPLFPITRLSLDTSVIGLNVGYDRTKNLGVKTRTWHRLLSARGGMVRGIRIFQSTALEMCAVARGSIDAFWGGGSSIWDICAGWIIVNESGGMIADGNRPAHPDQLEKIEEPSLKGKLLLAVRQGQTKEQMDSFAREFWGMIEGRLDYSE